MSTETKFTLVEKNITKPKGLIGYVIREFDEGCGITFETDRGNLFGLWEDGDVLEECSVYNPYVYKRVRITKIEMETID